jgi:hypothetical protein
LELSDSSAFAEAQVREMAKLTISTNKLNDIQIKNLKMYPFVFFNGVSQATLDYDLGTVREVTEALDKKSMELSYDIGQANISHLRVSYGLVMDETQDNDHMEKRFEAIEKSVRNLLFDQIKVQVSINSKLVYESKNV